MQLITVAETDKCYDVTEMELKIKNFAAGIL